MIGILAILALPIAFLSGGVAFNAWRTGEMGMAVKAGAVFTICALLFIAAPKTYAPTDGDCWTDWDGRSNPTVCE